MLFRSGRGIYVGANARHSIPGYSVWLLPVSLLPIQSPEQNGLVTMTALLAFLRRQIACVRRLVGCGVYDCHLTSNSPQTHLKHTSPKLGRTSQGCPKLSILLHIKGTRPEKHIFGNQTLFCKGVECLFEQMS